MKPKHVGMTIDQKFLNATWFDFFEQYIVPSIESQISYNQVVESINYAGNEIWIKTASEEYTADKVIIAVPVKMLQIGAISFTPDLPDDKQEAINKVNVWDGCKAFIEFSEPFYPALTAFDVSANYPFIFKCRLVV